MANLRLNAAFAGAFIALLILLLLFTIVPDQRRPITANTQTRWQDRAAKLDADGSVFLLGAGKADITGYFPFFV